MEPNLSLSIPKPCSEKWNHFSLTQDGGFCSSCNKLVIDFTKMNDEQILQFFTQRPAHTCGRFRPDQLKIYTTIAPLKINPGFTLLKAGILSMLFLLVSKQTSAQTIPSRNNSEIVEEDRRKEYRTMLAGEGQILTGIVLSHEDGTPLPGVNVVLKGSSTGTVTDANGEFEFPTSVKEGDVIVFSFIGLVTEEYVIPKKKEKDIKIKEELKIKMECDVTIMGEVNVDTLYMEKQSAFSRMWSKVKKLF